jgi:hypothetical protein
MTLLYLDPGSGALFAQAIAAIAGGFIIFRNTVTNWFKSVFGKKKEDSETNP